MKSKFLLVLLAAAALTSCSTAYKSGQTPDDVYYSPENEKEEYVDIKKNDDTRYHNYQSDNADDRWLRMRVRNPYRWNAFDDYDWNMHNSWTNNYYNPYSYNWNSYWNGYYNWNSWYNPYCRNVIVVNPKSYPNVYTKVRNFSLNSYTNNNYGNNNMVTRTVKSSGRLPNSGYGSYNNSNSGNSLGTSIRKVFSGNNNGNSNNNSNNTYTPSSDRSSSRSYTPSSSSGSSSSGTSSSSSGSSSSGSSSSGRRGG